MVTADSPEGWGLLGSPADCCDHSVTLRPLDRLELYSALELFDETVVAGTKLSHLTAGQAVALRERIAMLALVDPGRSVESIVLAECGKGDGVG